MKSARSAVENIETFFIPEMFEEIKILFTVHSTENFISSQAIAATLRAVGQELTSKQLRAVMLEVDADGRGALDFQQYVKLMENLLGEWDFNERLVEAFKVFDTEDLGSISVMDLKHVMETLDFKMSEEETNEFLAAGLAESESSGDRIDYRAFSKVMCDSLATSAAGKGKKGSKKKGGKKGSKKGKKKK